MNVLNMEPTIEFNWEEFLEEDCSWSALFVRINNANWFMAQPAFGTEDIEKIKSSILNNPRYYWSNDGINLKLV